MATTNFDTDAFDRAMDGLFQIFSKQQAEALAGYQGDETLRVRIEELAEKNTEGELTDAERAE